jgi:hypothetical protein
VNSIVQDWATELGLRHQGVLVSAVRGCDSITKEDPMKLLTRFYRACVLKAHVGDARKASSYMIWCDHGHEFWAIAEPVLKSFDHYPVHFLLHFLHASEILGYKMPSNTVQKQWWLEFYRKLCRRMHINPETEVQLDERLNANEDAFARQQ